MTTKTKTEKRTRIPKRELLRRQNAGGLALAAAVADKTFGPAAALKPEVVFAVYDLLDWDEAGDPVENTAQIERELEQARQTSVERFGAEVGEQPLTVLGVYTYLFEDEEGDDEEDEDEE